MEPNKEHIRQWVEALRSGEFKQGASALRHENAYCCLGVACELYRRDTEQGHWQMGDSALYSSTVFVDDPETCEGSSGLYLPRAVAEWLGVDKEDPELADESGCYLTASDLNDKRGWGFPAIADAIEEKFLT